MASSFKDYFKKQADHHAAEWQKALDAGNNKEAEKHMTEALNYQAAYDQEVAKASTS